METSSSSTDLGNGVKAIVRLATNGFIPEVIAPDVYTGHSIVNSLGRKAYKTLKGAEAAAIKGAHEGFAHIIDPETYWA